MTEQWEKDFEEWIDFYFTINSPDGSKVSVLNGELADIFKNDLRKCYKAATEKSQERERKLVEALRFYANELNYHDGRIDGDMSVANKYIANVVTLGDELPKQTQELVGGNKARQTLKELGYE